MKQRYWFKRKLYGYGWTPATWEGWVALLIFSVLVIGNWLIRYEPRVTALTEKDIVRFVIESFILVVVLLVLCVRTGESPRWQWGKRIE